MAETMIKTQKGMSMMLNVAWRSRTSLAGFVVAIVSLVLVLVLFFYRHTTRAEMSSVSCPPDFMFDIVHEDASISGETKDAILVMPKSEYTEPNLNTLFICYSKNNPKARMLIVRLFTNKALARPENFHVYGYWRHFIKAYPFDATLVRDYGNNGASSSSIDEYYEYRPITWIPFWTKRVILRHNEPITNH